ncbi:MAG: MFS transporter, partial [Paracoccaceae bacterium]|nr:MFS transporter [Paracoccaceae bacterium]
AFGWRETMLALAVLTLALAAVLGLLLRDPPRLDGAGNGSIFELLKMPALWPVMVMMMVCYAPAAGLRGLWIGPYYADVFGADAVGIGRVTLVMGLAMVAGNFAYGPLDRLFRTRKGVIMAGNLAVAACLCALWFWPTAGGWATMALVAGVGLFGSSFPMVMAHGRAFVPPHLMGRGVTLLNLFGIGAAGLAQIATGRLHAAIAPIPPEAPYTALFASFTIAILVGAAIYAFAPDRTD